MIAKAGEMSREPGHWWADQLRNRDGADGYAGLGEEIWRRTGGQVDALVHTVSTARSVHGVSRAMRRHRPDLPVFAVEPDESAVLSGRPPGSHKIEGIGLGFLPPLRHPEEVTEVLTVPTEEAKPMARALAREEAVFAGTSTGANVVAALRVAERLGPGATVATIIADSGLRYVSTDVFRKSWREVPGRGRQRGGPGLGRERDLGQLQHQLEQPTASRAAPMHAAGARDQRRWAWTFG